MPVKTPLGLAQKDDAMKFRSIVADPPWAYDNRGVRGAAPRTGGRPAGNNQRGGVIGEEP